MYAIIRAGGHQEKVAAGERITVDRLHKEVGEEIRFTPLVIKTDEGEVVTDKARLEAGAAVVGTVIEHLKGQKVDVFQYRHKTNYRRHVGHRQQLTLVEIAEIRLGDSVARAEDVRAAEAEAVAKAAEEAKAAAEAPKEVKPRARRAAKATAGAKTGAKKTPAKKAPGKARAKKRQK
ncbi:MAG: 50S ribosomal protein L21 [Acidobacteria bacterium]|nr:50S ribosomal protein L21 [Acidobacteriota bacterium]